MYRVDLIPSILIFESIQSLQPFFLNQFIDIGGIRPAQTSSFKTANQKQVRELSVTL